MTRCLLLDPPNDGRGGLEARRSNQLPCTDATAPGGEVYDNRGKHSVRCPHSSSMGHPKDPSRSGHDSRCDECELIRADHSNACDEHFQDRKWDIAFLEEVPAEGWAFCYKQPVYWSTGVVGSV